MTKQHMRSLFTGLLGTVVTFSLTGCTSFSNPFASFLPNSKPPKKEEFYIPPEGDKRYSESPTYPEHTLKPTIKQRGGIFDSTRERPQMMQSGGAGMPGMMPGGY